MKRILAVIGLCIIAVMLSCCSSIAKSVLGIEEIKDFDINRVNLFLDESQNIVKCNQIVATKEQVDSIIRLDLDSTMMQHRAQPVQVLYFAGDLLVFYHINCYTQSGFMSFDWNNYGSFDSFPPSPDIVEDIHGSMSLDKYRGVFPELGIETQYTIIILWSNMLQKVSRKAVETVANNIKGRSDCMVTLINTDKWWVDYLNNNQ